jgi:hypothetical protein
VSDSFNDAEEKPMPVPKVMTGAHVPAHVYDRLSAVAAQQRTSRSAVLVEALSQYLFAHEAHPGQSPDADKNVGTEEPAPG